MPAMLNHKCNLSSEIDKDYLVIYFIYKAKQADLRHITAMTNDLAYKLKVIGVLQEEEQITNSKH